MRPKKTRWLECGPFERLFLPKCKPQSLLEEVNLELDEFEALRLYHLKNLKQEEIANIMRVHRTTVSRIIRSAHKKLADALINIKAIRLGKKSCNDK